jgi:hypothetical protein
MDQSFCLVGGLCYSLFNQQKHEMSKKDGKNDNGKNDNRNDGFINFSQITDYDGRDTDEFDWSISSKEHSLKTVWVDSSYDDDICNPLSEESNDEIFEDININEENKKENFVIKFNKNRANNLTLITRYLYSIKEETEDDE